MILLALVLAILTAQFVRDSELSAIPRLIKQLDSVKPDERLEAVRGLMSIGPDAYDAVPSLLRILKHRNLEVRVECGLALAKIDSDHSQTAISALENVIKTGDPKNRWLALKNLEQMSPAVPMASVTIIESLMDSDENVRYAASSLLAKLRLPVESAKTLTIVLKHGNPEARAYALNHLRQMGPVAKETVGDIQSFLQDRNKELVINAAAALARIEPNNHAAVAQLREALRKEDFRLAKEAAVALLEIDPRDRMSGAFLAAAAADSDVKTRESAINLLFLVGTKTRGENDEIINGLAKSLKDPDPQNRSVAASAFGYIGVRAKSALPSLIAALEDSHGPVRKNAADALGALGREAKVALPQLEKRLNSPDIFSALKAASAMARIDSKNPSGLQYLSAALGSDDEDIRTAAVTELLVVKSLSNEVRPAVLRALVSDSNSNVREAAAVLVGLANSDLTDVISHLQKALDDGESQVRLRALESLGLLWKHDLKQPKIVLAALSRSLSDENRFVRQQAAKELGRTGEAGRPAVDQLLHALEDQSGKVREEAAKALGAIGSRNSDLLSRLERASNDKYKGARLAANQAIKSLRAKHP